MTLHDWQPQGKAYAGLPETIDEALRRIRERFVVEDIAVAELPGAITPPADALSDYCFDLRRI